MNMHLIVWIKMVSVLLMYVNKCRVLEHFQGGNNSSSRIQIEKNLARILEV